jgi:hypothetical protein
MCTRAACRAISGTNWIALAPVPTTATRRPSSGQPCSQRAECHAGPRNRSRPGMSGTAGRLSWPTDDTTDRAVISSPPASARRQRPSSNVAETTSA